MKLPLNVLACAVVAIATGCGAPADPVRIGFNVPLTGFAAADGRSALEGPGLRSSRSTGRAASAARRSSSWSVTTGPVPKPQRRSRRE